MPSGFTNWDIILLTAKFKLPNSKAWVISCRTILNSMQFKILQFCGTGCTWKGVWNINPLYMQGVKITLRGTIRATVEFSRASINLVPENQIHHAAKVGPWEKSRSPSNFNYERHLIRPTHTHWRTMFVCLHQGLRSDIIKFGPNWVKAVNLWPVAFFASRDGALYTYLLYQQGPLSMQGYIGWPLAAAALLPLPALCTSEHAYFLFVLKFSVASSLGNRLAPYLKATNKKKAWKWKLNTMLGVFERETSDPRARAYTKRQTHAHNWSRKNGTGPASPLLNNLQPGRQKASRSSRVSALSMRDLWTRVVHLCGNLVSSSSILCLSAQVHFSFYCWPKRASVLNGRFLGIWRPHVPRGTAHIFHRIINTFALKNRRARICLASEPNWATTKDYSLEYFTSRSKTQITAYLIVFKIKVLDKKKKNFCSAKKTNLEGHKLFYRNKHFSIHFTDHEFWKCIKIIVHLCKLAIVTNNLKGSF